MIFKDFQKLSITVATSRETCMTFPVALRKVHLTWHVHTRPHPGLHGHFRRLLPCKVKISTEILGISKRIYKRSHKISVQGLHSFFLASDFYANFLENTSFELCPKLHLTQPRCWITSCFFLGSRECFYTFTKSDIPHLLKREVPRNIHC